MKSLVEIARQRKSAVSPSLGVGVRIGITRATLGILGTSLGSSKAEAFANETAAMVTDEKFLQALEGDIGLPRAGETEDEFVSRAKDAMFSMLKKTMK